MALRNRWGTLLVMAVLASGTACSEDILDITNPNNPDVERATSSPEDVVQLAYSSINNWYQGSTGTQGVNMVHAFPMFMVTSDVLTANFGNFGMRFNNVEPRIAFNNSTAADDGRVASEYWDAMYAALGTANDALRAFAAGVELPDNPDGTEAAKHIAMFTQAAVLSNLALGFDSAFVVDEATDVINDPPELQGYAEVAQAALARWDALIAATTALDTSYKYGVAVIPAEGGFDSQRLNRLANTYAALLMSYNRRLPTDPEWSVDWAKVASYAEKGIGTGTAGAPFDFTIVADNDRWWSYIVLYGNYAPWMRVDMRIINMADPSQPAKYDGNVTGRPRATGDQRLLTDIRWFGSATERAEVGSAIRDTVIGDPARGTYMMSSYAHKRYEHHAWHRATFATGPVPYILAAESDLVRAEALARVGGAGLVTAAELINRTRVDRGGRTSAIGADQATLLDYINYERNIELMVTNGWDLFRNRIAGTLQAGTLRHLPVPAKELEILSKPTYSYGGAGNEM